MVAGKRNTKKAPKRVKTTTPTATDNVMSTQASVEATQEVTATNEVGSVLMQDDGTSLGNSLFNALMEGASAEHVVNELLRIYNDGSKDSVCCAILNLAAKASGSIQAELDASALKDDVEISTLLEELYARVPENAAVYPLVKKDPKYRVFRTSYRQFFKRLVDISYTCNVLLDGVLFPTILRWIIAMSESKARCFRHTSIVALLSIVGSLNGLIRDLNNRLPSHGRGKKQQKQQQQQQREEVGILQENIQTIIGLRNHIISQAIHQRPRDVAPEIRHLVLENLEDWILKYDEEFAENKYFRYFGMALYDKKPEIRAEALTMIQKALMSTPESGNRMFLFLQYFANRLVEMCSDVNMRCAELAIGVIVLILRVYGEEAEGKELIDNEMIDRVLLTLFDERPTIRREAGVLLKVFIESRISVNANNTIAYQKAGMELLCAFASTLRSQYDEIMSERYLIDALYTSSQELPSLLQEYSPILDLITADDVNEVMVGLGMASALLEKMRGRLDIGPIPKEDRRQGIIKKSTSGKSSNTDTMEISLSCDVGILLPEVLEKHRGDVNILCGVSSVIAVMNFNAFTSVKQVTQIKTLISLLRKSTAALPSCEDIQLGQVTSAWLAIAFEDHPMKSEGITQLQELVKQILKQFSSIQKINPRSNSHVDEKELLHVWSRLSILSSLVSVVDQWGLFKASIVQYSKPDTSPELLRLILLTSVRCIFWQLGAEQQQEQEEQEQEQEISEKKNEVSTNMVNQMIGELLSCIYQIWSMNSEKINHEGFISLFVESMVSLCDLCSLKYYSMSQMEQDVLLEKFGELSELLSSEVRAAKDKLRDAEQQYRDAAIPLSVIAKSRRELSHLEASQLRVTAGMVRLLLLHRLAEEVAPRILVQWSNAPTKTIADIFRNLFRTLRDCSGDSFALEKSILVAAYNYSSDALYQMGLKLSSMHWPLPDKYYSSCISIVRFGMDFATSTDPAFLQAIVAYCPKLLKGDALAIAQSLSANEKLAASTDPNARLFISAIRRAARLEDVGGATPIQNTKRPREGIQNGETTEEFIQQQQQQQQGGGDEQLIINSPKGSASRSRSRRRLSEKLPVLPNRVITEDGWHVRCNENGVALSMASSTPEPVETTRVPDPQSSKAKETETVRVKDDLLSSLAGELDRDEVFIATQEYD
ncbi:cohesin complex subunit SA-1/2 [Trypanosoma theileri]|uniref:Cohesin complex subunit SA-1/2 n=1 Tax=Trypanosoma theileri TaxID=67003 RepID=A0A1X0P8R9_9TRYP|nr:cohesin complex subunit SA-1/2 [Trypanosoma theileri]ORC93023.1 cohesin complex subunit SA-1/2 [Trypanosoma theileri]